MSDTPSAAGQLRTAAGKVLDGEALESFVAYAPAEAFVGEDGALDEEKVIGHLTALYAGRQQRETPQWGQYSGGGGPGKRHGDDGRAALQKRHGVKNDAPQLDQGIKSGDDARAALERRYGKAAQ